MNATRQTAVLSGLVGLLMITALFAPAVSAQPDPPDQSTTDDDRTYRIVQGDQTFEVRPIQGEVPVEEFYDYRYPYQSREDPSWGRSFSSEGTTDLQEDRTSILMLYEGPDGVSLVAIHDKYYEDRENGTAGSSVSFELTGLPDDGEWAVIDDDYDWRVDNETVEKDDIHQLDPDHRAGAAGTDGEPPEGVDARLSWVWTNGRTDGMAYRGLGGEDVSVTIDPAFNEDSYHRYGDDRRPDEDPDDPEEGEEYNGTIDDWQVVSATEDGDDIRRSWFDSLEEEVTIEPVSESEQLTASLSGPEQATVDQNATFSANATGDIETYEWSIDGTPVDSADGSMLTHAFEEAGTAIINVTATTAAEQSATASTTVEVAENETTGTQATEDGTPGFGIGAALAALGGVLLLAARQRGS